MEEKRFKNYDKKDRSTGRKNFSDNQSKNSGRPRQNRDDSKGRENAVVGRNAVAELLKTGTPIDKILVSGVEGSVKVIVAKAKEARIPVVDTHLGLPRQTLWRGKSPGRCSSRRRKSLLHR